jgi:hypothetical protein
MTQLIEFIKTNPVDSVATLIAILALLLTIWEGVENRRKNRLSTQPILNVVEKWDEAGHLYKLCLSNDGFGPGIIEKIVYQFASKEYPVYDIEKLLDLLISDKKLLKGFWGYLYHGASILPNREYDLIGVKYLKKPASLREADKTRISDTVTNLGLVKIEVTYRSIYNKITVKRVTLGQ